MPTTSRPQATLLTLSQYLRFAGLTALTTCSLTVLGLLHQPQHFRLGYAVVQLVQILILTEGVLGVNYYLRYSATRTRRWLQRQAAGRRQAIHITASLLMAISLGILLRLGAAVVGHENTEAWSVTMLSNVVVGVIMLAVQTFIILTERLQYLAQENEQFKRTHLQARFDSLKEQLSPHFLFNSLTTLRGLIHEDPADAERFVEEMAYVYRYLLHHTERNAVVLQEEVDFLLSYAFLLQQRFGGNLRLSIDLPQSVLNRLVPPMALQTLVENAVKHNVVSRQHPLHLYIEMPQPDCLQVRHVRRPRLMPAASSGTGLLNLAHRVRLLHQAELIVEADTEFRVSLPLPG